jgi:hypothetical protein
MRSPSPANSAIRVAKAALAKAAFALTASCGSALAVAPPPFIAGHHAAYVLTLKSSQDQGVLAANGSMTYDVNDACTGYTTAQHLVINLTNRDARDVTMVSDYATFETKDGTRLTFHTRQMTGTTVTEQLDGTAVLDRSGGSGHADFTTPDHRRVTLPQGTLLPNAHTLTILQGGLAGKRFLSMPLFDGAQDTFVTIEQLEKPHSVKWSALSALPSARVHVAFYDRDQGSEIPNYEIGVRYFDNGVADDLAMNFGDFVMGGKLTTFEAKTAPRC